MRTAPLWTAEDDGGGYGRRARRRFAECYGGAGGARRVTGASRADRLPQGASAAGPSAPRRTVSPVRCTGSPNSPATKAAWPARCAPKPPCAPWSAPAARRAPSRGPRRPRARPARRRRRIERALRPLSLDWYGDDGLGSVDLCHATSGGPAALPGLLARHFSGRAAAGHRVRRAAARPLPRSRHAASARRTGAARRLPRPARRRGLPAGRDHHPRQHPRPALAGAVRRGPRETAHRPPRHGGLPLRRGRRARRAAGTPAPSSGSAASNPPRTWSRCCTPSPRSARRSPRPGCGSSGARRRARRAPPTSPTARRSPPSSSPTRPTGAHAHRRQPGLLRGDRRPRAARPRRRVRRRERGRPVEHRRGLPHQPGRGDVLRAGHGLHRRGRRRRGHRRHRAGGAAAQPAGARRGVRGAAA